MLAQSLSEWRRLRVFSKGRVPLQVSTIILSVMHTKTGYLLFKLSPIVFVLLLQTINTVVSYVDYSDSEYGLNNCYEEN